MNRDFKYLKQSIYCVIYIKKNHDLDKLATI